MAEASPRRAGERLMPLLQVQAAGRNFGGVAALTDVSIDIDEGETVGLIGPNGAGKSTLLNVIAGVVAPSFGTVRFAGREITGWPAHKVCRLGIAKTSQLTRPFSHLTVRQNIVTAAFLRHSDPAEAHRSAGHWMQQSGLIGIADRKSASLSTAERKRLEVARALATEPRLLLLDEVVAGLSPREVDDAVRWIAELSRSGLTLLVTEHLIPVVADLADRIVVLEQGRKICEETPEKALRDPQVWAAYLGTDHGPTA